MPVIPAGMWGSNNGTPRLSVLSQLLNVPPLVVMERPELPFYSSSPGFLGSPSFVISLWCAGDVTWLSSLITCPIHLHRLCMMMVPMLSWLEMVSGKNVLLDSSRVLGEEGWQCVEVAFSHLAYNRVESA